MSNSTLKTQLQAGLEQIGLTASLQQLDLLLKYQGLISQWNPFIAIMCPQIDVTCVDTVAKKAAFITQASLNLQLKNLHGIHSRVEQYKTQAFDVVCSRAFASLADFTNLTMFHVKQDTGFWFALKGKYPDDEIIALPKEVYLDTSQKIIVPQLDADRCVLVLKKST
jgi:16S rRNA (guanine527-N7)-methyltransferase